MARELREYFPRIYDEIREIQLLSDIQDPKFELLIDAIDRCLNNTFVLLADLEGIEAFERIYNIVASPATETIEFRRERVLNRVLIFPPLTMPWFRSQMDSLLGTRQYEISMDYDKQTLSLQSLSVNQNWYYEVIITLLISRPAAVVLINTPIITEGIYLNETVAVQRGTYNYRLGTLWRLGQKPFRTLPGEDDEFTYNYRLGTTWSLGEKPFRDPPRLAEYNYRLGTTWALGQKPFRTIPSLEDWEVVKMPSVRSIENQLLFDTANRVREMFSSALLNDTVEITELEIIPETANTVMLRYTVLPDMGLTQINNIKLKNALGQVLTSSQVFVPIMLDTLVLHRINIEENVNT